MSTNSNIEWTEATLQQDLMRNNQNINQRGVALGNPRVNPRIRIRRPLRAITRRAARNYISVGGSSALAYRLDVIPSRCWILAIRAAAREFFHEIGLDMGWNWGDTSLPGMGALSAVGSEGGRRCVSLPLFGIAMRSAQASSAVGDPGIARPAPTQSKLLHQSSGSEIGSRSRPITLARITNIGALVVARAVNAKLAKRKQ